jgi:hypothetical protein
MRENANSSSRIDLDESDAKLFPCLLDYIYTDSEIDIDNLTLEQLFELYHLAEYFQIPRLQETVAPKMAGHISLGNVIDVLTQAKKLQNPTFLLDAASERLGAIFIRIPTEVASQLEPTFFLKVWNVYLGLGNLASCHGGRRHPLTLVMACLEHNQDNLSAEVFNEISSSQDLNVVEMNSAHSRHVLQLLAMESRFLTPGENTLSVLQMRFMSSLSTSRLGSKYNMRSIFQSKEEFLKQMSKLPQILLAHMFTHSVWEY